MQSVLHARIRQYGMCLVFAPNLATDEATTGDDPEEVMKNSRQQEKVK